MRKFLKHKKSKGTSLAELCVVLGLVSIISLSVISFTTLVSVRSGTSTKRLMSLQDLQLCQEFVSDWVEAMAEENAQLSVEDGHITAVESDTEYTVSLKKGSLVMSFPQDNEVTISIEHITALSFEIMSNENGDIVFCTIEYEINGKTESHTFCIYPHYGSTSQRVISEVGG